MGQVSRPFQILLAATALFFGVWFVALRPKPESAAPPASPGAAAPSSASGNDSLGGLSRAVDAAKGASTTSDQANARAGADQATQGSSSGSSSSAATKKLPASVASVAVVAADQAGGLIVPVKAVDLTKPLKATLPADAQRALDKGKVLVLLFWNGKSSDDKCVRAAVKTLSTHRGKVFKDVARLNAIGRYSAVTNGVPVLGSPTVIVVGKKKSAVSFTGFVDRTNIDQAVRAAL